MKVLRPYGSVEASTKLRKRTGPGQWAEPSAAPPHQMFVIIHTQTYCAEGEASISPLCTEEPSCAAAISMTG